MKAFGLGLCQEKLLKADKRQVSVQFRIGRREDHKAYHDAPSAIHAVAQ